MNPKALLQALSLSLVLGTITSFAADDTAKDSTSGNTKFKAKPKWSEAKPMEVKAGVSTSTGDQKVTMNPQAGADLGVAYVGVGAKVDISTLPPDPKDKWINPASLGGVKVEATPESKVAIRAGNVEISATKTAPEKKVTSETRFKGRENKTFWGESMKAAVATAEADDEAFAAQAEKKQASSQSSRPEKGGLKMEERMAEMERADAEKRRLGAELTGQKVISGYAIYKRPANIPEEDWKAIIDSVVPVYRATLKIGSNQMSVRLDNFAEADWNALAASNPDWVFQPDAKP